jgi:uncharacterized membrane protein
LSDYAHLFYAPRGDTSSNSRTGGLAFPETPDPAQWEFLYFSFVLSMAAQVSDVSVLSSPMRRVTLLHSIVSFVYNTVLIALSVNAIVSLVMPA